MKQQKDALIELEIVWEDDLLTAPTREHVRRAIVALSAAPEPREPDGWVVVEAGEAQWGYSGEGRAEVEYLAQHDPTLQDWRIEPVYIGAAPERSV